MSGIGIELSIVSPHKFFLGDLIFRYSAKNSDEFVSRRDMQSKRPIPFTRGQIRSKTIRRFTVKNHKAVITAKKGIGLFRMILC